MYSLSIIVNTSILIEQLTCLINYLITPWHYGPLRALTSLNTDAHSSLSNAFCHHHLTCISSRSRSTPSSHLNLALPLILTSLRFTLKYFNRPSLIHSYCMSKRKVYPRTGHEGPNGYSSTLSLTSALDGVVGQRHAPAALPPGKTRYPLYRRLRGPQGRSG